MFMEGTKGKERGDLEVPMWGKNLRDGMIKKGWSPVNGLVRTIIWPCPVPDQHRLSYLFIKFHF